MRTKCTHGFFYGKLNFAYLLLRQINLINHVVMSKRKRPGKRERELARKSGIESATVKPNKGDDRANEFLRNDKKSRQY